MERALPRAQPGVPPGDRARSRPLRSDASFAPAPARHLSAWPRRIGRAERTTLGRPSGSRRLCRYLPRRDGPPAPAPLVGLSRPDHRPRADAGHRPEHAAVVEDRPTPYLRARRKHGRPGDAAPARPAPTTPRRRGGVRLGDELLPALWRLRGHTAAQRAPGARPPRSRRYAPDEPDGVR